MLKVQQCTAKDTVQGTATLNYSYIKLKIQLKLQLKGQL